MEITKLSTKGQIVIPEKLRSDLEVGEAFVVIKKENLLEAYRLLDEHMDLIYDRKQSF